MAADGMPREIHNPLTGEHISVLQRSSDTDGRLLKVHITMPPTGMGPPGHRHKDVVETYTVESGKLTVMCGGKKTTRPYGPGEFVRVEPLTAHRFRNHGPEVAEVDLEVVPASDFETHLHAAFGLARHGRTTKHGMPKSALDMALLFELSDTYLLGMPMWFQTGVFSPLAALARWLGRPPDFPEFWDPNHAKFDEHDHDHTGDHGPADHGGAAHADGEHVGHDGSAEEHAGHEHADERPKASGEG